MKNHPLRRPPATQTNLRPPHTPPTPVSSRTRSKSCPSTPSTILPGPRTCPGSVYLPDGRRRSSRLSVSDKDVVFRDFRAGEEENRGCGRRRSVKFRVSEKGRASGKEGRERRRSGRFSVSEKDAAFGEIRVSRSSGRLFRGGEEGNGGCERRRSLRLSVLKKDGAFRVPRRSCVLFEGGEEGNVRSRSLRLSVLEKDVTLREIRVPRRSGGEEEDRGCVERPCTRALRKALSFEEIRVLRRCDGLKGGEKEVGGSTERRSVRVSFSEKDMACRDRVLRSSSRLWKEEEGEEHHTNLMRRVTGKGVAFERSRIATRLEKLKGREGKISDCRERGQRTPPMRGGESKRRRVERIDGEQAEVIMCSNQRILQSTTLGYRPAEDGGNAVLAADRGESGSLNSVERTLTKERGRKTAKDCSTEKFLQNTPSAQERAVENRRSAQTRMQHRQHGLSKCSTSSVQLEVAGNVLTEKQDTKRKRETQNLVASMEGCGGEKQNELRDVIKVGCERKDKVDCDSSGWTKDQDLALRRAYLMANPSPHLWKKISKMMPGKSAKECYNRIHSYNETPPLPVPRSRKNKNCISPLNIFNLSNSKPGEGFNDKVKRMKNKQQRRILVQKTVRHILKKHSAVDQGQETDLFSVFEPSLNTTKEAQHDKLPSPSNNVMKPNKFVLEERYSFPTAPESLSTKTVGKENKPSPAVLKQIKNINLHEKYINKLHEREARRQVSARASGFSSGGIAKENVMPKAVLMKDARSSLLSKAKEAIDQYRKKAHSQSNFLGGADTDCDDSNNSECDSSPS